MTRLILWRHGQTEWNATRRWQGQLDVELDETGVAQANAAATRLAAYAPEVIVSSDLRRAFRTAQALSALVGVPVEVDPRLRERHFGPWQGLTVDEIQQRYPSEYARWRSGLSTLDPEIEPLEDVAKRVSAALRDIADRVAHGTAVIATHGGAARVGCASMLGWPQEMWHTIAVLGNCHHTDLRHVPERGWHLRAHNVS